MLVVHTAGDPPKRGRIILATIGCTKNSSPELIKRVRVNMARKWNSEAHFASLQCRNQAPGSHVSSHKMRGGIAAALSLALCGCVAGRETVLVPPPPELPKKVATTRQF